MNDRRHFLKTTGFSTLALSAGKLASAEEIAVKNQAIAPIRKLTKESGFHWFGYYRHQHHRALL